MATAIQASNKLFSLRLSSSQYYPCSRKRSMIKSTMKMPKVQITTHPLPPQLSTRGMLLELEELQWRNIIGNEIATTTSTTQLEKDSISWINTNNIISTKQTNPMVISKLYAIMEAVSDRVEMHENIGKQRDNWNHLLLTSINVITLTAATMCGLANGYGAPPHQFSALKMSSTILFLAATGMLAIMNAIQPSQLAEEQRNASRLFKQLHGQIHTILSIGNPTINDVNEAVDNVLALDRAYPLPLLGVMLEKFPSTVKPAVWWPQQKQKKQANKSADDRNGWNSKLENKMREIVGVLKRQDKADYLRLSEGALKVNKIMAISGPLLTFAAAMGSTFVGSNQWAAAVGVVCGGLASIVNAMEHGGQVGMVFEMYRSNAGFFKLMEETIESNINETDVNRRENGEILEMKVALHLGRSLSELRNLAAEEFASKLF